MCNTYYKKIINSLGELTEISSSMVELKEIDSFGALISERSQPCSEHFIWREIRLYHKGLCNDIRISGYEFSPIVKVEYYDHFYKGTYSTFEISGRSDKGERFTFKSNLIRSLSDLTNIVFAIIIISSCQDINYAIQIWNYLTNSETNKELSKQIDIITALKDFCDKISETYPFVKYLFRNNINQRIEQITNKLKQIGDIQ